MNREKFDAVRWLNAFAKKMQEADLKNAVLTPALRRCETQRRILGEGHALIKDQSKLIRKLVDSAERGDPYGEFSKLAGQLDDSLRKGEKEMGIRR